MSAFLLKKYQKGNIFPLPKIIFRHLRILRIQLNHGQIPVEDFYDWRDAARAIILAPRKIGCFLPGSTALLMLINASNRSSTIKMILSFNRLVFYHLYDRQNPDR